MSRIQALVKEQKRKYGVAKVMDYLQWVLLALELLFLLRFVLKLIGADPNNPFAQALYNFTGFLSVSVPWHCTVYYNWA